MGGFATLSEEASVTALAATVNGFALAELRFPPGYVQAPLEPELPYLAVVLEGSLEKTFPGRSLSLAGGAAVTIPAGALHGARFGRDGARIVIVKLRDATAATACSLERLVALRSGGTALLAWRLAGELHAADRAAPLAAEGLALELLATAARDRCGGTWARRPPRWLLAAEEALRERVDRPVGLGELAAEVGVHPTHLARAFRRRHGVSVGEYGRRLRLAWAAGELATGDLSLGAVAAQAGFADQSHFTRAFRAHAGVTPARYRAAHRR